MKNQNINFGFVFNFTDRDIIAREKHKDTSLFLTYNVSDFCKQLKSYLNQIKEPDAVSH